MIRILCSLAITHSLPEAGQKSNQCIAFGCLHSSTIAESLGPPLVQETSNISDRQSMMVLPSTQDCEQYLPQKRIVPRPYWDLVVMGMGMRFVRLGVDRSSVVSIL